MFAEVLALLKLAHKYCIPSLERQSLQIVLKLTRFWYSAVTKHLQTIKPTIYLGSDYIASVAGTIQSEELLRNIANSYLNVWHNHNSGILPKILQIEGKMPSTRPLQFAKKHCQSHPDLYSRFLYEAMIAGAGNWSKDPKIPSEVKLLLGIGSAECCNVWEQTMANRDKDVAEAIRSREEDEGVPPTCPCNHDRFHCRRTSDIISELWKSGAVIPAYDIIGKLEAMLQLECLRLTEDEEDNGEDDNWDCRHVVRELVHEKIHYHRSKLPEYFHLE